jgi:hypothetical protein
VRGLRDVPGSQPLGIWEKSDQLLIKLLEGFLPEKYKRRGAVELSGTGGAAIDIVQRLQAARARMAQMPVAG